jgi:hypothetical protein
MNKNINQKDDLSEDDGLEYMIKLHLKNKKEKYCTANNCVDVYSSYPAEILSTRVIYVFI